MPRLVAELAESLAEARGPGAAGLRDRLAADGAAVGGFIDAAGFSPEAGGWLFQGWVGAAWPDGEPAGRATACVGGVEAETACVVVRIARADLPPGAAGIIGWVQGVAGAGGRLEALALAGEHWRAVLAHPAEASPLDGAAMASRLRRLLGDRPGADCDALRRLLQRPAYTGRDTLGALGMPVFLAIDEAIAAGPNGLVLLGWMLAHPGTVRRMTVRCGTRQTRLDLDAAVRLVRTDVLDSHPGAGFTDARCGFVAFLPDAIEAGGHAYIEVEAEAGEVGHHPVPAARLAGLAAIQRLLAVADVRFGAVRGAFDAVLGPAVVAIQEVRLLSPPGATVVDYGTVPQTPDVSVVIPLYGRLDYVDYQLALFSEDPGAALVEWIYVLDEPARRREAEFLFASAAERFGLGFRAVMLDANAGFGPASNIGLRHASGRMVVFMNSDVFPAAPGWLGRLVARLDADPGLGVAGPLLLFEDGSVQHGGMAFARVAEFGGLHFGMHPGKGMRPPGERGLREAVSITGACMVMRRSLALEVGGFDERYVVGDFEDSDLCLRLRALGYRCAVDTGVELYHLERRSQAGSDLGWRMNLTVYNAWRHERLWGAVLAEGHA